LLTFYCLFKKVLQLKLKFFVTLNFYTFVKFFVFFLRNIIINNCFKLLLNKFVIIFFFFVVIFVKDFIYIRNCFIKNLFNFFILAINLFFKATIFEFFFKITTTNFILKKLFIFKEINYTLKNSLFFFKSSLLLLFAFFSFYIIAISLVLLIKQKKAMFLITNTILLTKDFNLSFIT